jgi:4-carboxymuconolactone decarboxylase
LSRIPLFPEAGLSPEQRVVYDKVATGPRGTVVGPIRAALHSPKLADRWQSLGEFLRYQSSLPARLSELAILVCGRYWNSDVEWYVHADVALRSGLSESVIDAMRRAREPHFEAADEATVYEYARQLLENGRVADAAYQAVRQMFGEVGVVELTALVGYYTMVAMTLNAHHVPTPEPSPAMIRTLDAAATAKDGGPTRLPAAQAAPQTA